MTQMINKLAIIALGWCLAIAGSATHGAENEPTPASTWTSVIRHSPYWISQGVFDNIITIRQWVLEESGYCTDSDRHILYDLRGRFLGYIDDGFTVEATQKHLNDTRASMARRDKVEYWVPGSRGTPGYPFALACDQPHVNVAEAVARYLGTLPADLLWGAWDDLDFASETSPRPLHEALLYVLDTREAQGRLAIPPELPRYMAGQILIESSGRQKAHSVANAKGILQLSPEALGDCEIRPANYWHRLAQIDCALRLMQQNARNLRPAFDERFGELPEAKRQRLFTLLLVQAYHGGAARVRNLLSDDSLSRPAAYFAKHHEQFSAGDIAFGMVFHNLGRDRLGLASLYYVADVEIAAAALCRTPRLQDTEFCNARE